MNDLQLAIVGVGATLVAGLWGHWKWQELRHRRVAQRLLDPTQGDALLAAPSVDLPAAAARPAAKAKVKETPVVERREPVIDLAESATDAGDIEFEPAAEQAGPAIASPLPAAPPAPGQTHRVATPVEPVVSREASSPAVTAPPARPAAGVAATAGTAVRESPIDAPPVGLLSPEVDFIAAFDLAEAVSGDALLAVARDALPGLKKRIAWVGFDAAGGQWEMLRGGGEYRRLRVGIQLADRAGPLSAGMLEQFRRAMERVGDELTAVAEMPATREALALAIKLDRICAEVDIQLTVNVVARHPPFRLDAVREAALAVGFRLGADGQLAYGDAGGQRLFALQSTAGQNGLLSFVFDLPAVNNGELAFDRMMRVAKEFADAIDGLLVDDQKRPVTDRFIAPVRGQVKELQARMAVQGIPAGSEIALRLFA